MNKLFVDKTIEISATPDKVWEVLTEPEYTKHWTGEFENGMHLESDWKLGSPVVWKMPDDNIVVEGNVTKIDPPTFLRYTVFDVQMEKFPVQEEDGITFELTRENDKTILHLIHGDFSVIPEGEKYYQMTVEAWDKVLPKVKELAENS